MISLISFRLLVLLGLLAAATCAAAQRLPRPLSLLGHHAGPLPAAAPSRPAGTATFRPRQTVRYDWDVATAAWVNPLLDQFTYNAQGRPVVIVTADSVTMTPFRRALLTYDAQGNRLEEITQTGNGMPWLNEFRYASTYDAQNSLTEELSQTWTGTAWQTTDGYRYQNTYTSGVLTTQTVQILTAGVYQNEVRFAYQLSNGQWAAVVAQRWDGTDWVNEERLTDLTWHDWPRRQPAGFRVQAWLNSGQWTDFQRHTLSYSATGTVVQLVEEALPSGGWQNYLRYTEPYDARGTALGYRQEDWQANEWVLTNEVRAQVRYDAQDRLVRRTEQLYSPITAQFANRTRINYGSFQDIITSPTAQHLAKHLHLFPQPATNVLHLEMGGLSGSAAVPVEIRTLTGQVLHRTTGLAQQGTLHLRLAVSALPPGLYTLHLLTGQGVVARRFSRQ